MNFILLDFEKLLPLMLCIICILSFIIAEGTLKSTTISPQLKINFLVFLIAGTVIFTIWLLHSQVQELKALNLTLLQSNELLQEQNESLNKLLQEQAMQKQSPSIPVNAGWWRDALVGCMLFSLVMLSGALLIQTGNSVVIQDALDTVIEQGSTLNMQGDKVCESLYLSLDLIVKKLDKMQVDIDTLTFKVAELAFQAPRVLSRLDVMQEHLRGIYSFIRAYLGQ